jgi:hypothetical protein
MIGSDAPPELQLRDHPRCVGVTERAHRGLSGALLLRAL